MRYSWLAVLLVLAAPGYGLSPLETDRVLCEGNVILSEGRWATSFGLDKTTRGLYLNVEGIERFTVMLNGRPVKRVEPGPAPRTRLRTVELTDFVPLLRPGTNRLEISTEEPVAGFWLRLWASDRAWYLSSFHAHTTYSDGAYSVCELLQKVSAEGGRAYAITDHSTMEQCYDTAFHPVGNLNPIRGTEWTTDSGHSCVLGLAGASPLVEASVHELIDEATYRGGMMQINHPCDFDLMEWKRRPMLDRGVDMIEIFNSLTWFPPGGKADGDADAVAWWHSLLSQGRTVAGVGNSDYHGTYPGEEVLKSNTRVFAPSNDPDTILRYSKLGNAMVCDAPDDTRLYLYADTNNNGQWDLVMGEHCRIASGSRTVRFRLEVENADWLDMVSIHDKTGEVYSRTLWTGGDYEYEWSRSFGPGDRNFMRVALRVAVTGDYETCTNPIYVNHPDYELGPVALVATAGLRPDTLVVGREDTLRFGLANTDGYSPYRFGLAFACDTGFFDIAGWQAEGPGIGEVVERMASGHRIVEWRGGFSWQNRLTVGRNFDYWLSLVPRLAGDHPLLWRSWADDRFFVVDSDPDSGFLGPEAKYWHRAIVPVRGLTGIAAQLPAGTRLLSVAPVPSRGRVFIRLEQETAGPAGTVSVLDRTGRLVARRDLGKLGPGRHELVVGLAEDGSPLPAGVYFLRLERGPWLRLPLVR